MLDSNNKKLLPMLIILALGISSAGFFIGNGFVKAKIIDRYVTVKGLSERYATSDLAIWPINIKVTGNDLSEISSKIAKDQKIIENFFMSKGFDAEEIEGGTQNVVDLLAQTYRNTPIDSNRYIVSANLTLRTNKIDLVKKASQTINEVIQKGVVFSGDNGDISYNGPRYEFTKFNEIKPEMLAEANKNALRSAEQFALSSGSKVGMIHRASQGVFHITAKDASDSGEYGGYSNVRESIDKKIRVVTTIEYFIID
jgi:hypothetical protein